MQIFSLLLLLFIFYELMQCLCIVFPIISVGYKRWQKKRGVNIWSCCWWRSSTQYRRSSMKWLLWCPFSFYLLILLSSITLHFLFLLGDGSIFFRMFCVGKCAWVIPSLNVIVISWCLFSCMRNCVIWLEAETMSTFVFLDLCSHPHFFLPKLDAWYRNFHCAFECFEPYFVNERKCRTHCPLKKCIKMHRSQYVIEFWVIMRFFYRCPLMGLWFLANRFQLMNLVWLERVRL